MHADTWTDRETEGGRDGRTHGPWLGPSWAQVGQVGTKLGRVGPSGGHVEGQVGQSWGQVGPGGGHVEGIFDFHWFFIGFHRFFHRFSSVSPNSQFLPPPTSKRYANLDLDILGPYGYLLAMNKQ